MTMVATSGRSCSFEQMDAADDFDVKESWRWLLIEVELARHMWEIGGPVPGRPAPNKAVLDLLFPSLLFIRAVSLLDEALGKHIDERGYTAGNSLHARLVCLDEKGELSYSAELRELK
ncbi:MAG: hypothetical protein JO257_10070, partial [Deltaproteobacteria bacterium]|nr:hypothetical protein [Deltaproteobacteria bacterium]